MLKLLTTLLIISISGCATTYLPSVDVERCVIVLPEPQPDGTFNPGFCRCHMYRISHEEIGRVGESENKPLSYCNKFVGFHAERGWIPLLELLEEAYGAIEDGAKKNFIPRVETKEDILKIGRGQ